MVQILDVMKKALEGAPMRENDWQRKLFAPSIRRLVKEHGIKFDPDNPIHSDDSLADDVFEAGFELLLETGVYCTDTSRIISYTEEEIKKALRNAPDKLQVGEGRDRKEFVPRKTEDKTPPWCLLGAAGAACSSDKSFLTLVEGYAEIPETNAITTPAITVAGGMRIRPASPLELYGTIRNAVLAREACNRAGRPGIPIMNSLATAESSISLAAALNPRFGMRSSDGYMIGCLDPMRVDFDRLNKVVLALSCGAPIGMDFAPLLGGYSSGPEGTAISDVAHHLMGVLTYQTSYSIPFPLHLQYISNSSREMLWVISAAGQAISKNTHLLSLSLNYTSAGPCTNMCLCETSASVISAIASGLSIESVGVASNKEEDRMTPVEPRVSAEIAHAAAGMKRTNANDLVKELLTKYESNLSSPPMGKKLFDCWDSENRKPSKEFQDVIRGFKKEIGDLGLTVGLERLL